MPLIGQPEEKNEALPVHALLTGDGDQEATVYTVFQAVEGDEALHPVAKGQGTASKLAAQPNEPDTAQAVAPTGSGTASVGLGILGSDEVALAIAGAGQGQGVRDVGLVTEVELAQPVAPVNVPGGTLHLRAIMEP